MVKIVLISDTHGLHEKINVPDGDMLIHAGDVSNKGSVQGIGNFLYWFEKQPHCHKIFIAGNHDFGFENIPETVEKMIPDSITYLNDSGIEIEGINIWGSPVTPWFHDWAFNRLRGGQISKYWDWIPDNTDILITHGPPKGILDKCDNGDIVGCEDLLKRVKEVKPKYHIFGHIHEGYGISSNENTIFINASSLNSRYEPVNEPQIIEL